MAKPLRPEFSVRTKLIFAKLDRKLPFDENAVNEMVRKRIIVRVRNNAFLRRRFEAAGHRPRFYEHLYAIPFRHPGYRVTGLHRRSLHSVAAGEREFVFKGTGTGGWKNFKKDDSVEDQDLQLVGGARLESVKHAVKTLSELERVYKRAQKQRDGVVEWAAKEYSVMELPAIKHVAVFRPLQALHAKGVKISWFDEFGSHNVVKATRRQITPQTMGKELRQFSGQLRVHVYAAQEPSRLLEYYPLGYKASPEETGVAKSFPPDFKKPSSKRVILKRFIARGLLLMHVSRLAKMTLTLTAGRGSVFLPQNANWLEFFDFDTARKMQGNAATSARIADEETAFAGSVSTLAARLLYGTRPPAQPEITKEIREALKITRNQSLKRREKFKALNEAVECIARAAGL